LFKYQKWKNWFVFEKIKKKIVWRKLFSKNENIKKLTGYKGMILVVTSNQRLKYFNQKGVLQWETVLQEEFSKTIVRFQNKKINILNSKHVFMSIFSLS
jgi:mannitol-1-phosphate/altronate dehydrogenase